MNRRKISTVIDGKKVYFDVILTFQNNINNKNYVVYTDNSIDELNKLRIFASIYNPDTLEFLGTPETQEEWNEIYKLLDKVLLNS